MTKPSDAFDLDYWNVVLYFFPWNLDLSNPWEGCFWCKITTKKTVRLCLDVVHQNTCFILFFIDGWR
jgi:hypothetical protein